VGWDWREVGEYANIEGYELATIIVESPVVFPHEMLREIGGFCHLSKRRGRSGDSPSCGERMLPLDPFSIPTELLYVIIMY
jgi:hypothetical protein